jgi:hypothetical protein
MTKTVRSGVDADLWGQLDRPDSHLAVRSIDEVELVMDRRQRVAHDVALNRFRNLGREGQ